MKKLINAPATVLAESLDGFAAAHADIVTLGEDRKFVRRSRLSRDKVVGAAAEKGIGLGALKDLGDRVNRATRSMGVALTSCIVPAAGTPTFTLAEDEMEMGVGIHGEPGRRRVKLAPADAIADEMVDAILKDLAPAKGAQALLFVNGFGGTPGMGLCLIVNRGMRAR